MPKCPYYPVSVLSVLIWTPRGHAEVSVLSGVRIKCVNMDTKGTRRSDRIIRVSVLTKAGSRKNVPDTCFIDTKTIKQTCLR